MYVATRSAARLRVAGACGGVPIALANPPPHLLRLLGAACDWDGVAGSSTIGRGLACFGVGSGCGGVRQVRAPTATRALSSSSGDGGGGGSSSFTDKLAAKRAARDPTRGAGQGERAAGGPARGGRGGSGAGARGGGRAGGGGRGGGGAGGGRGRSGRIFVPNDLILKEEDPERLLRLVADKLDNFDHIHVATAFSKLGQLNACGSFPPNIAADDGFRGLMGLARAMCADGRLQAQAVANIVHGVAKMSAAGKLAAADADVQDTLAALEERVVLVAVDIEAQHVSNAVYGFAVLGREPGIEQRAVLEATVVRVGPDMVPQAVANTAWSFATLGLMPGAETRAALGVAVVRVGPRMNEQDVANTAWSFATLGLMLGAKTRAALEVAVVRVGPGMKPQELANTAWSFATLGLTPGAEAQAALEDAVVRVGPGMNALDVRAEARACSALRVRAEPPTCPSTCNRRRRRCMRVEVRSGTLLRARRPHRA